MTQLPFPHGLERVLCLGSDRSGASGAAFRDEDVLLTKEAAGEGLWGLPGGGVYDGESLVAALERELVCQFEEHFFERDRGAAWRSRQHFYAFDLGGRVRAHGNG
ncbi:NUDIX domain-containing protein [Mycobacterium tilburgii]|uniref:NUDIX domain-containing protein n=1 Tax=Mycobacterium tilburgii TaxID=44467 RepID=UPI00118429BA|nr:NUDIX domain-containing protein [Mycobacterium tilburgii]